jgi:hypothetical protein
MHASRHLRLFVVIVAIAWAASPAGAQGAAPPPEQQPGSQQPPPSADPAPPPATQQQPPPPADPAPADPAQPPPPQEPTAPVPPGAQGAGGPTGSLPLYGATSASKIFNPDIAVIGNFFGAIGENDIAPPPVLEMRESEISFQAIVDPYARADFFVAIGEEGAELEEGYITFPTLPGGLLMKAGKLRAQFGKINPLHLHQIPWTDRPLMTDNLLGGDEGIGDAGISLAALIPNNWLFLEAIGEVFRGEAAEGDIFLPSRRSDVSLFGRLRAYQDLTESTNIDVGVSYGHGHNGSGIEDDIDVGRFTTQLIGADVTLRWKPLQRSIYRSFLARGEVVQSRREQPGGRQDALGFYLSADYQFSRRWFWGVRFDRSERADDAEARDVGHSFVVTFWPSEFSQIRGQYRLTDYAEGDVAVEFLFQLQFSIGAHGAHPF